MDTPVSGDKRGREDTGVETLAVVPEDGIQDHGVPGQEPVYTRLQAWLEDTLDEVGALRAANPVPKFDDHVVFYDAEHYYEIDGMRYRGSGTAIVHSMFDHFNEKVMIDRIIRGRRVKTDPEYRYYQMTGAAIAETWKQIGLDASGRGTAMHAYIEYFYNGLHPPGLTPEILGPEYLQFHRFHADHVEGKLEPFRTELVLFDEDTEAVGTIDMLYRRADRPKDGSQDHILIMYDWKRSKELKYESFNPSERGKGPCGDLKNCNVHHYYVQLNLYRCIIERNTEYRVAEMYLGVFHPNYDGYKRVQVESIQPTVQTILGLRRLNLLRDDRAWMKDALDTLTAVPTEEIPGRLGEIADRWKHLDRLLRSPELDALVGPGIRVAPYATAGLGVISGPTVHPWYPS